MNPWEDYDFACFLAHYRQEAGCDAAEKGRSFPDGDPDKLYLQELSAAEYAHARRLLGIS